MGVSSTISISRHMLCHRTARLDPAVLHADECPALTTPYLLLLDSPAASLETAGGKGANLARLIEAGFPVPEPIAAAGQVEPSTLPGGTVATTMHVGSYADLAGAYSALEGWFAANGFEAAGDPWETYLDGPEVDAPRTIISWPCQAT